MFGVSGKIAQAGEYNIVFTQSSDILVPTNLHTLLGSPTAKVNVIFTLDTGTVIASNVYAPGLTVSGFADGSTILIINNGGIYGKGGAGGFAGSIDCSLLSCTPSYTGAPGSAAISLGQDVTIDNNGIIAGGGGGGGGGVGSVLNTYASYGGGGGGGGMSYINSLHGSNSDHEVFCTSPQYGVDGGIGTSSIGGAGGAGANSGAGAPAGGISQSTPGVVGNDATVISTGYTAGGGGGGGFGAAGGYGGFGTATANLSCKTASSTKSPGAGGASVDINGHSITWQSTGTRYGTYT